MNNDITCSYECESILYLSKQNRLLHEPEITSFETAMTRSPTHDNLDEFDEDEYNINEDEDEDEDEHMSMDSSYN